MNRGAALLERFRKDRAFTFDSLGREMGCSKSTAWQLCQGGRLPSRKVAVTAFRVASVPLNAWDDPAPT